MRPTWPPTARVSNPSISDPNRFTVALTFDLNRALHHLGIILDRLIENDGEPVSIWYGYTQYLDIAITWTHELPLSLPFIDDVLTEINHEFYGSAIDLQTIFFAFDGLYREMRMELIYGQQTARSRGFPQFLIEGFWEEPMMNHHPMVVISTLNQT